jgi:hypothetical protein
MVLDGQEKIQEKSKKNLEKLEKKSGKSQENLEKSLEILGMFALSVGQNLW